MGAVDYLTTKFNEFRETLIKPKVAAHKLTHNASLPIGAKSLALFTFIAGFIASVLFGVGKILGSLVALAFNGTASGVIDAALFSLLVFVGYILAFVPLYVIVLLTFFVATLFVWILAKLLGGKAEFGKQFGSLIPPFNTILLAIVCVTFALGIITAIVTPISLDFANILAILFGLPAFLLSLYLVALWIMFTAEANDFEMWKAAVAVLVPFLFGLLVLSVIGVIFALMLPAALLFL